jgi:4-hydroxybenzoyl-CoA thioesterase
MSVFVVPDAEGVAAPIPEWVPDAREDVRLHEHALEIIRLREGIVPIPPSLTLEP